VVAASTVGVVTSASPTAAGAASVVASASVAVASAALGVASADSAPVHQTAAAPTAKAMKGQSKSSPFHIV
jgi:hypothetical protein